MFKLSCSQLNSPVSIVFVIAVPVVQTCTLRIRVKCAYLFDSSRAQEVIGEEEMTLSEAAMDAEWKRIQKKTFTRWCNEHLKKHFCKIEDLSTDLSDGIPLIILLEVLSQKKVGRYSKNPRVHAQRMENAQVALEFIQKEGMRLVNIGKH